jgi:hypothetical protein
MIFVFPSNSFPLDEKMNMKSVVDYFQEMYGYTIMHPHLPCIQVGSEKKANYLPMEVCFCLILFKTFVINNFSIRNSCESCIRHAR